MNKYKAVNLRIPKDLWGFLKRKAIDKDISLSALIIKNLSKIKKKDEKKALTNSDANI